MINRQNLFALLLFASISTICYSQSKQLKTDVNKDIDVVRVYEQVVKEGYGTALIYRHLATAYYFKNEYGKALSWFQKLYSIEKNTDPLIAHQYEQTLKAIAFGKMNKSS
ncbi:hypothetical protein Aeqsu_1410 [Aequorivita sublithincola DSM 14238]|uniref:Uncharacterized protein n=1 Tax=Aequorivita sublithincola (strain DSM 14238 / LMG 21431 / ACAM 643 / 9-3) TaxID=746697 RepID=I3YV85_AEQSU|nr:hypothetical protein [Aequorivita sublithincola]AFL80903.1 hypothetical protein Aeqsu_1410 [Aequorivita sublithincola DSM 14238]